MLMLLLLQGGMEKLSDEAIEETLDKVVKLLAFISDKDLFAGEQRRGACLHEAHDLHSNVSAIT